MFSYIYISFHMFSCLFMSSGCTFWKFLSFRFRCVLRAYDRNQPVSLCPPVSNFKQPLIPFCHTTYPSAPSEDVTWSFFREVVGRHSMHHVPSSTQSLPRLYPPSCPSSTRCLFPSLWHVAGKSGSQCEKSKTSQGHGVITDTSMLVNRNMTILLTYQHIKKHEILCNQKRLQTRNFKHQKCCSC